MDLYSRHQRILRNGVKQVRAGQFLKETALDNKKMNNYAFSRMDLKEDEKIAVEEKKAKLYVPSPIKTQKNLVPFCFWADWAVRQC